MTDLLTPFIAGPVLPATTLIILMIVWSVLGMVGAVGVDALDFDVDHDLDVPEAAGGLGALTINWLNLRNLPLMLWLGVFALCWWGASLCLWYGFDRQNAEATWWMVGLQIARNVVIGGGLTKAITQPMSDWFKGGESFDSETLLGETCEISTMIANSTSGQAKFKTDAAPLLLNVNTDGEELTKGTRAQIVAYDAKRRIYTVTRKPTEETT